MKAILLSKLAALALLVAIVATISITMAAPARPRVRRARPRAAVRPARLRPVKKVVKPVRRVRLAAPRPVIVAGGGGTTVVVDKTAPAETTTDKPVVGEVSKLTLPADADESLSGAKAYKVVRLEGGGLTAVLEVEGEQAEIRMVGVAPLEASSEGRPGRRSRMTEMFLDNILRGESVHVVYDSMVEDQDEEGKYVAYLYRSPDGLLVNTEVIRQGFAAADTSYEFEEKETFAYYQNKAKSLMKGLWAPRQSRDRRPGRPGAPGRQGERLRRAEEMPR